MHSYNSPAPLVSTELQTRNLSRNCQEVFALPTLQSVQTLDKDFDSAVQLSLSIEHSEHGQPPILIVDDKLPAVSPFLIDPVKGGRFKLYANHASRQEYAGYYYDFEVAYFLRHWPRLPAPSVAEFIAVAEQVVSRGYVPPSQMSAEQIQVLKGGLDVRPLN